MNVKIGLCVDCTDKREKPLIAGRCNSHYWKYRAAVKKQKAKGTEVEHKKKERRNSLDLFFDEQIKIMPERCENCLAILPRHVTILQRSTVCHIVPKRHFHSVETNPLNVWFGCMVCHHNYDDRGWSYAVHMNIWPEVVERFLQFADQIDDSELKHLPDELRKLINR